MSQKQIKTVCRQIEQNRQPSIFNYKCSMIFAVLLLFFGLKEVFAQTPATLPWTCDFENTDEKDNWILDNGNFLDNWVINLAVQEDAISGYSLYVSDNGGSSYAYSHSNQVVVASRLIESSGSVKYRFSFDWKCKGEGSYDYFKVFLVDTNVDMSADLSALTGFAANSYGNGVIARIGGLAETYYICNGYIDGLNNYNTSVQHFETVLTSAQMGTTGMVKKLVIVWKSDNSTFFNPPAALDNFSLQPIYCNPPLNLTTNNVSTNAFNLSWTPQDIPVEWHIQYKLHSESSWDNVPFYSSNTDSYSITSLEPNTTYDARVRAICNTGGSVVETDISEWSEPVTVTTIALCASPTGITVPSNTITANEAVVNWNTIDEASLYEIVWKPATETSWDNAYSDETYVPTYTLTGLSSNTTYNVRVRTLCNPGISESPWSNTVILTTQCGAIMAWDFPYIENFDNTPAGTTLANLPTCWTRNTTYSTNYSPYVNGSLSASGPNNLYFLNSNSSRSAAILPPIDSSVNINNIRIRFKMRCSSTYSGFQVGVMTNPSDWSTFVQVGTEQTGNGTNWVEKEVLLNSYIPTNPANPGRYIAIASINCESGKYPRLDDLIIDTIPVCEDMYNFSASYVGYDSVKIMWNTLHGAAYGWNLVCSSGNPANFDPENPDMTIWLSPSDMPFFIAGLTMGETYTFSMQTNCGGEWASPISITIPEMVTVPYEQDFEDVTNVTEWYIQNHNNDAWIIDSISEQQGNALFISDDNTTNHFSNTENVSTNCAYIYVSFPQNEDNAAYNLSFDWRCKGGAINANTGDFGRVYLLPANYLPSGTDFPTTGQLGNNLVGEISWQHANFILPANQYAGQVKMLLFIWRTISSYGSADLPGLNPPLAIDNVSIVPINCIAPSNVFVSNHSATSAVINWTPEGTSNVWQIYYKPEADYGDYDVATAVGENSYQLNNLQPNTSYTFFVVADCGTEADSSTNYTFRTLCSDIVASDLPYIENFDTDNSQTTFLPYCWQRKYNSLFSNYPQISSEQAFSGNFSLQMMSLTNGTKFAGIARPLDAAIDMSLLRVVFKMRSNTIDTAGVQIGVLSNPNDWNTFVPIGEEQMITVANSWETKEVALSDYTGQGRYIAVATMGTGITHAYIDDFVIEQNTSLLPCPKPTNLMVSNTAATSSTVSWTAGNSETEWLVEFGEQGSFTNSMLVSTVPTTQLFNLQPETNYNVRIKALCYTDNESDYSDTIVFSTSSLVFCHEPTDLFVTDETYNSFTITWIPYSANETVWAIQWSASTINIPNFDTVTHTTTYLIPNKIEDLYAVCVQALCPPDMASNPTCIEADFRVNIPETSLFHNVKLYPNPAHHQFSIINWDAGKNGIIEIYDMLGKLQQTCPVNISSSVQIVDITNLSVGMYYVRLQSDTQTIVKKMTKH